MIFSRESLMSSKNPLLPWKSISMKRRNSYRTRSLNSKQKSPSHLACLEGSNLFYKNRISLKKNPTPIKLRIRGFVWVPNCPKVTKAKLILSWAILMGWLTWKKTPVALKYTLKTSIATLQLRTECKLNLTMISYLKFRVIKSTRDITIRFRRKM